MLAGFVESFFGFGPLPHLHINPSKAIEISNT